MTMNNPKMKFKKTNLFMTAIEGIKFLGTDLTKEDIYIENSVVAKN